MGIYINGKPVTAIYRNQIPIVAVYRNGYKVWPDIIMSCFYNGYWIDEYPWTDNTPWTD